MVTTGTEQDRAPARKSSSAIRVVGAALLGLLAGVAGFLAIGISYSFNEIYGYSDYRDPLLLGLIVGSVAAAAVCGAAALLGLRRWSLAAGLVVLLGVAGGTVLSGWMGGQAKEQGFEAAATACDDPVGTYAAELGADIGHVVTQDGHTALGDSDGACEVLVTTSGGDIGQLVSEAASESGWVVVSGQDGPAWARDGVTVTYSTEVDDGNSGRVFELRAIADR